MRRLRYPARYLIAAAILCGVADVPAGLAVPLAVIGLQAMSLPRYLRLYESARSSGGEALWWRAVGLSVALAAMMAGGAFVLGRVAVRVWGVL